MFLDRLVLSHAGPFRSLDLDMRGLAAQTQAELTLPLTGDWDVQAPALGEVRSQGGRVVVLHGAGATGKSLILASMANTRPGHTQRLPSPNSGTPSLAQCSWSLEQEEPNRPHPLVVTSGSAGFPNEVDTALRREQLLYDRKAAQGGFAVVLLPAHRRFGQSPIYLGDPGRTMQNYDPRAGTQWADPARADLTRPVKQILAYASFGAAMSASQRQSLHDPTQVSPLAPASIETLDHALRSCLAPVLAEQRLSYIGADPASFEPTFRNAFGSVLRFDELSQQARHLVAPLVLAMHHFWTSSHGADPRAVQGVIAMDDAQLHLTEASQETVLPRFRELLPQAQWIVATTSWRMAASVPSCEVIALRQQTQTGTIDPYQGHLSVTH